MVEIKSRGGYLVTVAKYGDYNIENMADCVLFVPTTESYFTASLAVVPLQLLSYYVGVNKGVDVDKPRNLAKSVTVE